MKTLVHPENIDLLMEALDGVRNPEDEMIEERSSFQSGDPGKKLPTEMGAGKDGASKERQSGLVTKYKATSETVNNINHGMTPKNAIKAAMDKYKAGMGNHNPDVKDILSDLALNYPHMFNKHFRKAGTVKEDVDINEDVDIDTLREEALDNLREFLEARTGMDVSMEEAAEFMLDTISEAFSED